tara:strand:+ start:451 stop:678 length:228 start_codon:yes stop_codon:yes gene_type:complete
MLPGISHGTPFNRYSLLISLNIKDEDTNRILKTLLSIFALLFMYEINRRGRVNTTVRIIVNKRYMSEDIAIDVSP